MMVSARLRRANRQEQIKVRVPDSGLPRKQDKQPATINL